MQSRRNTGVPFVPNAIFFCLALAMPAVLLCQIQSPDINGILTTECAVGEEGQFEAAVVQAGPTAVPAFISAAQNGPDSNYLSLIGAKGGREYDDLAAYFASGGGAQMGIDLTDLETLEGVTRDQFIQDEVANAVLHYRARALSALGILGGTDAINTLRNFAQDNTSPFLQAVALAALQGPTTMAGNITSKVGPLNARVWTLTLTNNGPGAAMGVQVNSVNLTQVVGAACTPIVTAPTAFPLSVGSIAPAGSEPATLTINFTGCPANARFTANISFSANSGAVTGTVIRYNQFE